MQVTPGAYLKVGEPTTEHSGLPPQRRHLGTHTLELTDKPLVPALLFARLLVEDFPEGALQLVPCARAEPAQDHQSLPLRLSSATFSRRAATFALVSSRSSASASSRVGALPPSRAGTQYAPPGCSG